jgi:hypothetical protein
MSQICDAKVRLGLEKKGAWAEKEYPKLLTLEHYMSHDYRRCQVNYYKKPEGAKDEDQIPKDQCTKL